MYILLITSDRCFQLPILIPLQIIDNQWCRFQMRNSYNSIQHGVF